MPSKNTIKQYAAETCFHIYNRGVERRGIFLDERDYRVFLNGFKQRLSPPSPDSRKVETKNFLGKISLHAYCLMPNHFHLLICQHEERVLPSFMRSLMNSYVGYFNRRYVRVGSLFQGAYKASQINADAQFLQVGAYIHRNPHDLNVPLGRYPYSSYHYHAKGRYPEWLRGGSLDEMAGGRMTYRRFVELKDGGQTS